MSVKVHNTKTLKRSQTTINGLNIWSDIDFDGRTGNLKYGHNLIQIISV